VTAEPGSEGRQKKVTDAGVEVAMQSQKDHLLLAALAMKLPGPQSYWSAVVVEAVNSLLEIQSFQYLPVAEAATSIQENQIIRLLK
jgi:hypothetical protein